MIDHLTDLLRDDGKAIAAAWQPALTDIDSEYRGRVTDWERVFPGLVALIGFQGLLWPLWHDAACIAPASSDGKRHLIRRAYTAPTTGDKPQLWRFAFTGVAERAAWALIHGPALVDFDQALKILTHRDVALTLGSLDATGKVVVSGWAANVLEPLLGKRLVGDAPIDLPICDSAEVQTMLPAWRESIKPVEPIIAAAAGHLRECLGGVGGDTEGLHASEAARLTFACLGWHVWQGLLDLKCFTAHMPERPRRLAIFGIGPARLPFMGVLMLRGDHWALWQDVKKLIARDANHTGGVDGGKTPAAE